MCMDIDNLQQELGALQLSDSFFPTGLYATSNGLESLFLQKRIHSADDVADIIKTGITQQVGTTDCIALAETYRAISSHDMQKIIHIDNTLFATKCIKETRDASTRSGIQLVKCVTEFVEDYKPLNDYCHHVLEHNVHGVFPVAFAVCCSSMQITKEKSALMMLYGFTVSMVGAAMRLGIIQHIEGQRIIHGIKPVIGKTLLESMDKPLSEMSQFAPQMDVTQMSHEQLDSKMFIT